MAEHWTHDPSRNRATEVPAYHIHRLAAQFPEPRSARPDPGGWSNMLHQIALEIWAEAYAAGAAYGLSIGHEPRYIFVTEEQQAALVDKIERINAETVAEIHRKVAEQ